MITQRTIGRNSKNRKRADKIITYYKNLKNIWKEKLETLT